MERMNLPVQNPKPRYLEAEIEACIALLQELLRDQAAMASLSKEQKIALMIAAGRISRPDKEEIHRRRKHVRRFKRRKIEEQERKTRAQTGIRSARTLEVFSAPERLLPAQETPEELRLL